MWQVRDVAELLGEAVGMAMRMVPEQRSKLSALAGVEMPAALRRCVSNLPTAATTTHPYPPII